MNNPEEGSRGVPRRTILKGMAVAGASAITSALGWKVGRIITPGREESTYLKPQELSPSEQHKELFKKLFEEIDSSITSDADKEKTRKEASELSKIIDVNDDFLSLYQKDVNDLNEPKLLDLYRKKYAPFQIESPESMIFIVNNNKKAREIIIDPIAKHINEGEGGDVLALILGVRSRLEEDGGHEGEQKYTMGPHIRLKDYVYVDTKRGGSLEIRDINDTSEEGRKLLESDKAMVEASLSPDHVPRLGETIVNLPPARYSGESRIISQGADGIFIEAGLFSEVKVNDLSSKYVLYHEVAGHGLDILVNDTQLFRYLSPHAIYDLLVLREEALASEEWGRSYPSLKKIFARRPSVEIKKPGELPSGVKITPPGVYPDTPMKIEELRMGKDNYPDGVFCTGRYNAGYLDENKLIRWEDRDVIREYRLIIEQGGGRSSSLEEFLHGPNNPVLGEMKKKSPWIAAVFDKLDNILPEINYKTYWLPQLSSDLQDPREITNYKIPGRDANNVDWYDFCIEVGQRLAVIEMLKDNDPALSILTPEEKTAFQKNLLVSFSAADQEMFANMMGVSLTYSNISSSSPNPYLKYLERIKTELQARAVMVVPSQELMAAISRSNDVKAA